MRKGGAEKAREWRSVFPATTIIPKLLRGVTNNPRWVWGEGQQSLNNWTWAGVCLWKHIPV